jgi:hypothetical protein
MDASRLSDFLGDDGGEYPPAFAGVTLFRLDRYEFRKGIFAINGHGAADADPGYGNGPDIYCPLPTADYEHFHDKCSWRSERHPRP